MDASRTSFQEGATLYLRLLGGFEVLDAGECVSLPSRKDGWLLAMLALANGRALRRQELHDALWSRGVAGDPAFYLRRSLSHLRKALPRRAHLLHAIDRQTLRLDLREVFVDALAFEEDAASDEPMRWRKAVAAYAGLLLPECQETWAFAPRRRLHRLYQDRVIRLGQDALETGDLAAMDPVLLHALELDPLWEEGLRLWMRLLAAQGKPHEALQSYQRLERLLQRDDPRQQSEPETAALARQIREQARRPAPRPPASPRHNLPAPVTSFIGRETEIAQVAALLEEARLLTLTGAGGCGKTRLALQVAQGILDRFPEGVWWVELAPLSDPAQVVRAVADVLEVKERPGETLTDSLAQTLRGKRMLLVLDNCEHVLDAAAALAHTLLRRCPGVTLLTTSRERLNTEGEATYRVPSLSSPGSDFVGSLESLKAFESVRLFLARAALHQEGFAVTEEQAPVLASICRRLDGIPLALELAAARSPSMTLAELQDRLEDRFAVLTGGSRTAPARHQTLRALIDWSDALLSEAERALLRRLSVFVGGCTREAAEQVCAGGPVEAQEVFGLLTALVDKNLVRAGIEEKKSGYVRGDSTCYSLLETIRQFGQERLRESAEEGALRVRHRDYLLFAGERNVRWVWRRSSELPVYVCAEYANLLAALEGCRKDPALAPLQLRLAAVLHPLWFGYGHYREGLKLVLEALSAPGNEARTNVRASALNGAGVLALHQGDPRARALHEEALSIYQELGERRRAAHSLVGLGFCAFTNGDYPTGLARCQEGLAILRELGDTTGEGMACNFLGRYSLYYRDFDAAHRFLQEALASHPQSSGPGWAWTQDIRGQLLREEGAWEAARTCLVDALLESQSGNRYGIAQARTELGAVLQGLGDYAGARDHFRASLPVLWDTGERWSVSVCLEAVAAFAAECGRAPDAARLWGAAAAVRGRAQPGGHCTWFPLHRVRYERQSAPVREALGEAAFEAAWQQGRGMSDEEAVAFALKGLSE